MEAFFDFEKPIVLLEKKLQDLRDLSKQEGVDFTQEIDLLTKRLTQLIEETYSKLTPWQRVQLSRHPNRPYTRDYVDAIFPDFVELSGDRTFSDDQAILGGTATWKHSVTGESIPVLILGHQKGRSTKQKMERNFGMAKPEGYRKAMRLMQLAERARMPIITLIDTPGAYPGLEAEERGQSQAIAESIHAMFRVRAPIVSVVIGEGGSGGALALAVADQVLMMEHSTYSVISPESCASILWSDSTLAEQAAEKLKISAPDLLRLKVIDGIIPEPIGGAHRNWPDTFQSFKQALITTFEPYLMASGSTGSPASAKSQAASLRPIEAIMLDRLSRFRHMGDFALREN